MESAPDQGPEAVRHIHRRPVEAAWLMELLLLELVGKSGRFADKETLRHTRWRRSPTDWPLQSIMLRHLLILADTPDPVVSL